MGRRRAAAGGESRARWLCVPADPGLKGRGKSNVRLCFTGAPQIPVLESQHSDSFNPKSPDSPKNAANAAGFTLPTIPTVLLTLRDTEENATGGKQSLAAG